MQTNPENSTPMKRGEFLRNLGLSSATLMAYYCMSATLTACGGSDDSDDPTPSTGTGLTGNADTSKGAINFTLDLTSADYSKLKTNGQYAVLGSVIVAKTSNGSMVALSKTCTHMGVTVQYRASQDDLYCNPSAGGHGSEYSTTGAVQVGPANGPLTQYKTSLSADGNTLTVTA